MKKPVFFRFKYINSLKSYNANKTISWLNIRNSSLIIFNNAKGTNSCGKTVENCIWSVSVIIHEKTPKCKWAERPLFSCTWNPCPASSYLGAHSCWFLMSFGPSYKAMTSSGLKPRKFPFHAHSAVLKFCYA